METPYNTVWLIDDNEIDNFINKKIILKTGFANKVSDFSSATAAETALEKLLNNSADASEIPEMVFLDLNMPMYSGTDFLKKCEKSLLTLNPNIRVVILTSSINPNDEFSTSIFSTFRAYINKPLNTHNLLKLKT